MVLFRKLDIYVVKKLLIAILFASFTMVLVFIAIDLVDKLDKFIDAKVPLIGFFVLYTLKIPEILSQIFPVIVFMSLLFTLGNLSKYKEITAMISSGISIYRISVPILITGVFLSIGHFFFSEILLPVSARQYNDSWAYYLKKNSRLDLNNGQFQYQQGNNIVYIEGFNPRTNTALGISIQHIVDASIEYRIDAKSMIYDSLSRKWQLSNLVKRDFFKDSLTYKEIPALAMNLDFKPKDIIDADIKPIEMGWFDLNRYIEKKRLMGIDVLVWEVERHAKLAYSLVTFIMILIAIPLSTAKLRASASVSFGISIAFAFCFYLIIILFKNWGIVESVSPFVAGWAPDLIFLMIAAYYFRYAKS